MQASTPPKQQSNKPRPERKKEREKPLTPDEARRELGWPLIPGNGK